MFAVLGLTPSLSWIPELPLLAVAVVVPAALLVVAGYRAGVMAGATAGGIAGLAGGVAYMAYGKPWLNVPLGLLVGLVAGLAAGFGGVQLHRKFDLSGR